MRELCVRPAPAQSFYDPVCEQCPGTGSGEVSIQIPTAIHVYTIMYYVYTYMHMVVCANPSSLMLLRGTCGPVSLQKVDYGAKSDQQWMNYQSIIQGSGPL